MGRGRKKTPRRKLRSVVSPVNCYFCQQKKSPGWRDYEFLAKYLSPRSRILPRSKTGLCAKHQRRLAEAIKHCRHLGLLPFVTSVKRS